MSGKYAEFLARMLFFFKGYKIVAKNYKTGRGTGAGEVDFIATRGRALVFVEVKKRKDLDTAAYSIFENQKERIIGGAKAFLKKHPQYNGYDVRFDAVLVELPLKIKHIQNAWQ